MVKLIATPSHRPAEDLEADFRRRPTMWIGGARDALMQMVHFFLQEALDGLVTAIQIEILSDWEFTVTGHYSANDKLEGGEDLYKDVRKLLDSLYEFSPFLDIAWSMRVINLASRHLELAIHHEDALRICTYEHGKLTSERVEATEESPGNVSVSFHCVVDHETIHDIEGQDFDYDAITGRLQQKASLINNLRIEFVDRRESKVRNVFQYPDGLPSFLHRLSVINHRGFDSLNGSMLLNAMSPEDEIVEFRLDYAFQFGGWRPNLTGVISFCNARQMIYHGVHVEAFLDALADVINSFAQQFDNPCYTTPFQPVKSEQVAARIGAIISIWHPHQESDNSMAWSLTNPEIRKPIYGAIHRVFTEWGKEHLNEMKDIVFWHCPPGQE